MLLTREDHKKGQKQLSKLLPLFRLNVLISRNNINYYSTIIEAFFWEFIVEWSGF